MRSLARACALAGLLACAAPALAELRVDIDTAGLSPEEAVATRELVDVALAVLPPVFRERLDEAIVLRWRDDLPEHVHGRARNGRIGLRRELLDAWMREAGGGHAAWADSRAVHEWRADAREISPYGRNDRTAPLVISTVGRNLLPGPAKIDAPAGHVALTALLHELAHLYDRSPQGRLSRDPRLLDLAGWPVRPLRFGLRASRNDLRDRSPDRYELESPVEFIAVNLEHFLLDPDYACRRPALHRHFAGHFNIDAATTACAEDLPFVATGSDDAALRLLGLDPARVASVDYLFAEANERAMSRWGHSMLRLVVCAPERPRGPDCRLDLEHHLVLSFRAFVDDVQISSWRGLTGAYPARLFVLPLGQVVDEYTKVELRGLQSIPLRLDKGDVAALLERAARLHWSYDGRYYFIGNNCAVETWKLLNDGVPRLSQARLRSITPTGLLKKLEREGVADASVLDDAGRALREGYRFESMAAYFADMFAVADVALALPADDAGSWFALDPAQRRPWLSRGDLRASAALLVLEQAALRREEAQAREALKRRFLRGDGGGMDEAEGRVRELLADGAWAGRPALLLQGDGYGLPQADERDRLETAVASDDTRLRGLRDDLYQQAREWLPPAQRARLEGTEANLAVLGERLRMQDAGEPWSPQ